MEGFSITAERIAAAGGAVGDTGSVLAREIATMDGLLGSIRSGWQSSEAAPRFVAAVQGYLATATTLKDALLSQGTTLVSSAQRFGETESATAAAIPATV